MSSHKSSPGTAVEPKRERGRLRVASILDAAAELFAERGYEATTMTELAERSHTAVGSLYRFFPTKSAVAEALAERYATYVGERLDALEASADGLAAEKIAKGLLDLIVDRQRERAVVALLEGSVDVDRHRTALRARYRDGIVAILRAARPDSVLPRAGPAGAVVLQMLKGVSRLYEDPGDATLALDELRCALTLFLDDVLGLPVDQVRPTKIDPDDRAARRFHKR